MPRRSRVRAPRRAAGTRFVVVVVAALATVAAFATLGAPARGQDCSREFILQRPLDDLRTGRYAGYEGGLYPGGTNVRPAAHDEAGRLEAERVQPLDSLGRPHPNGKVGFAALGFSIGRQVFEQLMVDLRGDPTLAPQLAPVNCAEPGQSPDDIADPDSIYWTKLVPASLQNAKLTRHQVQVAWLLTGAARETAPFPDHAQVLEDQFVEIARVVRSSFPNARILLIASLPYVGYGPESEGVEPYYFEQGFGQKWAIERQIAGDPLLRFDPQFGPPVAPWLSWGPYYWCDGILPRSDGLTWECADAGADGVHPSDSGRLKLAARLEHLLRSDPVTTPWFLATGRGPTGIPADVELRGEGTSGEFGEPQLSATGLPSLMTRDLDLTVVHAAPGANGVLLLGSSLLAPPIELAGGLVHVNAAWFLPFTVDAAGRATITCGDVPGDPSLAGTSFHAQGLVLEGPRQPYPCTLTAALDLVIGD